MGRLSPNKMDVSVGWYVYSCAKFHVRVLKGPEICDKTTGEPAIFSHAAIFVESDDPETGNYVPAKEEVPPGIDVKVV